MEQIQIAYQPIEDRLVMAVKAGDEQHKVWLTRRFVMIFLAQLHNVTKADPLVNSQAGAQQQQQIMNFQKEQAAAEGKIGRSSEDLQSVDDNNPPMLATGITPQGQTLHIICQGNKKLSMKMTTQMAYSMTNLLQTVLKNTGWGFNGVREKSSKEQPITPSPNWSVSLN